MATGKNADGEWVNPQEEIGIPREPQSVPDGEWVNPQDEIGLPREQSSDKQPQATDYTEVIAGVGGEFGILVRTNKGGPVGIGKWDSREQAEEAELAINTAMIDFRQARNDWNEAFASEVRESIKES